MKTIILAAIRCSLKASPKKLLPLTLFGVAVMSLFSVQPVQAYSVTLEQVGSNVVATGSGAIDLTGLTFTNFFSGSLGPGINPHWRSAQGFSFIFTGPSSSSMNFYFGATGPTSFGFGSIFWPASSGSGYMVGIGTSIFGNALSVPRGYVSGTALSGMATYTGKNFATLGVRPGTYVWTWGIGRNQNFTLQILPGNPTPTPTPAEW